MPLAKCHGPWSGLKLELPFKCHVDTRDMTSFVREPNVKYVFIDSEPPWACTPIDQIVAMRNRYDLIMTTYNEEIMEKVPGAIFYHVHHDPYMDPSYKPEFDDKKFYVSYLVSNWNRTDHGFWVRKPAAELLLSHSVPHKVWSGRRTPYPEVELLPQTYPPDVLDDYNKTVIFDAKFKETIGRKNLWDVFGLELYPSTLVAQICQILDLGKTASLDLII